MKSFRKLICALICVCMLVNPLSAFAATPEKVRIVDTSNDFLRGYYVVYETANGTQFRSDLNGYQLNYDLWKLCNTEDKIKAMKVYAYGVSSARQQYNAYFQNMCDWYNEASHWTEARQILEDRIAKRDFTNIYHMFVELSFDSHISAYDMSKLNGYEDIREVANIRAKVSEMKELWNLGQSAYAILSDAKMMQTSVAVKSISADLISFICERALVPAITPGGLSALMPSIKGEIIGLIDKITKFSDTITSTAVEKDFDSSTARQIIDYYWEIINYNEQLANYCITRFLKDKADLEQDYSDAIQAIKDYKDEKDTNAADWEALAADFAMAAAAEPAGKTKEALLDELNQLNDEITEWQTQYFSTGAGSVYTTMSNRLSKLVEHAYEVEWHLPGSSQPEEKQVLDMKTFQGERLNMEEYTRYSYYYNDGRSISRFEWLETEGLPSFRKACTAASEKLAGFNAYVEDYNALIDAMKTTWEAYCDRYAGLKSALSGFGYTATIKTPDDMKSQFVKFADACGIIGKTQSSPGQSVADYRDDYTAYEKRLKKITETLSEDCADFSSEVSAAASEYKKMYAVLLQAKNDSIEGYNSYMAAFEEAENKFYNSERGYNLSSEFQAKYNSASNSQRLNLFYDEAVRLADALRDGKAKAECNRQYFNELYSGEFQRLTTQYDSDVLRYAGGSLPDISVLTDWNYYHGFSYPYNTDYVDQALREFTRSSQMFFDADMLLMSFDDEKPNYMRMEENERGDYESNAEHRMYYAAQRVTYYGSNNKYMRTPYYGTYGNSTPWYDLYCMWGNPDAENSWAKEAENYVVVTDIDGPGDLTLQEYTLASDDEGLALLGEDAQITLPLGASWKLGSKVKVIPSNATEKTLYFETDNFEVCTVDGNGTVTAVAPGTAVISVRAKDSAWVEIEDPKGKAGEMIRVYTPAPLKYTVTVGASSEAEAPVVEIEDSNIAMYNYGTESTPRLYRAENNGDGTTDVTCAINFGTELGSIAAVMFYTDAGEMLKMCIVDPTDNYGFQLVSETLRNEEGLKMKTFLLDSDGWTPEYAPVIDVKIE